MALDKVKDEMLQDNIELPGGSVKVPVHADDAARNSAIGSPAVGMIIYNTSKGVLQQYNSQGWSSIDSPPTVSSLDYPGSATALDPAGVKILASSSTTSGDKTVTVSSTSGLTAGMTVTGTGIPSNTTITTITNATSLEISANASATGNANVTLTFNAQTVVITGTNFQTGATVSIDGVAPTTVTRNSSTQITITGMPAKAAATYSDGLKVTNPTGLAASIDVIYDALPAWTTSAGNIGSFPDGTYTANASAPRIIAAEGSDTITYAQTDSAGVVNTNGVQGLTLQSTGYLTGTLSATEGTTYNFYAKPTDAEGHIGAVRLFNIISTYNGTSTNHTSIHTPTGYRVHEWRVSSETTTRTLTNEFVLATNSVVEILMIGGGGAGGASTSGGGGAGGLIHIPLSANYTMPAGTYTIVIGGGGVSVQTTSGAQPNSTKGSDSTISKSGGYLLTALGGGSGGATEANISYAAQALPGGSAGGQHGYWGTNRPAPTSNSASTYTNALQPATTNDGSANISGTTGYGNLSGTGHQDGGGAGGGGAGGAGGNGQDAENTAAAGGAGKQINITGSNLWYAAGGRPGPGASGSATAQNGVGGVGGAGANAGGAGAAATGSGGGGAWNHGGTVGGNGGSGVVMIKYAV